MKRNYIIIFDNVADKLVTWSDKRIAKFVREYYRCATECDATPSTGDDAIDLALSCLLASEGKRGRGGQPGNKNAQNAKRNENECETNTPLYNRIEKKGKEDSESNTRPRAGELLPFPSWMTVEEKRQHLWRDCVDNQGEHPFEVLKEFAEYYGMPSAQKLGRIVCEDCAGWNTKTMLKRWVNNNHKR